MAKNYMVEYIGPKKVMHVPFPVNDKLPIESWSALSDIVDFPRKQMVELSPKRTAALLKVAPDVFRIVDTIKARPQAITVKKQTEKKAPVVSELTEEEFNDVEGSENPAFEDSEPADDHAGDGAGV